MRWLIDSDVLIEGERAIQTLTHGWQPAKKWPRQTLCGRNSCWVSTWFWTRSSADAVNDFILKK